MDSNTRKQLIEQARFGAKPTARSTDGMAITSHPVATRVAVDILRSGGNACDAALAASVTQTVVEPHMTTITGVLSQLYFEADSRRISYMNGGMNAPKAELNGFSVADLSTGRGVAVPGFWAGLEAALERHGSKPKHEILGPAIELARDGFEVHPFLFGEMFAQSTTLGRTPEGRETFMPEGALVSPGEVLRQPRVAETLERLMDEGNDYFYRGDFAREFCETVQQAGGVITMEDLEAYEVRWQEPARSTYRDYEVVGSPPPDSGGAYLIQCLNMVELLDLEKLGPPNESAESLYQLIRIHNEVAEFGESWNDPETHPMPLETILSKEWAQIRLELLQMTSPKEHLTKGVPVGSNHVTVVDGAGNVSTILHSCMAFPWANGLFVGGVSICAAGSHFLTGVPRPGARANTGVVPNIILRKGAPVLASGSPSSSLLATVLQNTVNILDFELDIGESVHRPRFGSTSYANLFTERRSNMIEAGIPEELRDKVAARGVDVEPCDQWNWNVGSFEGIAIDPATGQLSACGDPRRTSQAEGV